MSERFDPRHGRASGAYDRTSGFRRGARPRARSHATEDRPTPASDAPTMSFANPHARYRSDGGRGDDLASDIGRGFGFGIGFAAGSGLFRVIVFALGFGALMVLLLSVLAAVI